MYNPNLFELYNSMNFEELSYLQVLDGFECQYFEEGIYIGDSVSIVGEFVYEPIGSSYTGFSDGHLITLTRTKNYALLRAHLIYKTD